MSETKVHECCVTGFNWDGTPVGREEQVHNHATYVSGSNTEVAILMIHDLFGWKFNNLRLLADHYAAEADATVYLPDFFAGESLPSDLLAAGPGPAWASLDIEGFVSRNSRSIRHDEIISFAQHLRARHPRLGAIGFCWGGSFVFDLGATSLVDCISTAHPSLLTAQDIDRVSVPVQILAPEHDPAFTQDLRDHAHRVIPTQGVPYDYQYFPRVAHAFAVRGNRDDEAEMKAMKRAKDTAVSWFRLWLH